MIGGARSGLVHIWKALSEIASRRFLAPIALHQAAEVPVPSLWTSSDAQTRILVSQLSAASAALIDALEQPDHRQECVEEAREALETFEILERGTSTFIFPRKVRDRVHASLEALREGRLELAHASLTRAGGAFQELL